MLLVGISVFVSAQLRGYEQEYGATIYKGWNLVYGFTTPNQLEGQSLDKSHIKAIYAFMPMVQEYVRFYPNPEESKMENIISKLSNDEFNPSITALWVYSDATVEGSLNNIPHATEYWIERKPLPFNTNPLYKGWNFVGITTDMIDKTINGIKGNCNIERIYYWSQENQDWTDFMPHVEYQKIQKGQIGQGFVFKVSSDCRLGSPESSDITPPSIPSEGAGNKQILGSKCTTDEDCPALFGDWSCKNATTAQRFNSYYYCKQEGICGSSPGGVEYKACPNGCLNSVCN